MGYIPGVLKAGVSITPRSTWARVLRQRPGPELLAAALPHSHQSAVSYNC